KHGGELHIFSVHTPSKPVSKQWLLHGIVSVIALANSSEGRRPQGLGAYSTRDLKTLWDLFRGVFIQETCPAELGFSPYLCRFYEQHVTALPLAHSVLSFISDTIQLSVKCLVGQLVLGVRSALESGSQDFPIVRHITNAMKETLG
ncbi:hypothetical protein GOODEAATRI_034284, partial [Goodea atripinnis]